jgi:hypothetical protein
VSDEWRLTAELDGDPETIERVVVDVRGRISGTGRLTREGLTLRVYSDTEADAARAEALVLKLLERSPLGYELWHDRWDGEEGDWEEIAPDLPPGEEPPELDEAVDEAVEGETAPVEEAEKAPSDPAALAAFPGAATSLGAAGMLVLVTFADRESASTLRTRLTEAGIQSVARRRGVGIPADDEAAASELAAHLRSHLPPDTRIDTTRVPGRKRE